MVEVALRSDAFALSPRVICCGVGLLGVSNEGAVVECFEEGLDGGEGLVVIDELESGEELSDIYTSFFFLGGLP